MINTEQFKRLLADKRPQTAVILGSGLGSVADAVEDPLTIDYAAIEGFPRTTVAGHSGKMIVGRLGQSEVLCLQGRFHLYEGHRPQVIAEVVNALKAVGVNRLIVTNAAGSLNPEFTPGSLMLIKDHINFSGQNPLVGANDESTGPRFPDMSNAYDRDMRRQAKELAAKLGINLPEGVYLMVLGPNFETAAEIRAFRTLGADAVGMSHGAGSNRRRPCRHQSAGRFRRYQLRHRIAGNPAFPRRNHRRRRPRKQRSHRSDHQLHQGVLP